MKAKLLCLIALVSFCVTISAEAQGHQVSSFVRVGFEAGTWVRSNPDTGCITYTSNNANARFSIDGFVYTGPNGATVIFCRSTAVFSPQIVLQGAAPAAGGFVVLSIRHLAFSPNQWARVGPVQGAFTYTANGNGRLARARLTDGTDWSISAPNNTKRVIVCDSAAHLDEAITIAAIPALPPPCPEESECEEKTEPE